MIVPLVLDLAVRYVGDNSLLVQLARGLLLLHIIQAVSISRALEIRQTNKFSRCAMLQICDLPLVVVDTKGSSSPMQARCRRAAGKMQVRCVRELAMYEQGKRNRLDGDEGRRFSVHRTC